MLHISRISRLLVVALSLTSLAPAAAQSSAAAREWLEKMAGFYNSGPFTVDYAATLDLSQMGQAIRGEISGHMVYGDRTHRRLEITLALDGMPAASGETQAPMELEMLSISDGEVIWTEIDMKTMGGRQVMKIAQDDVEKLAASQGLGGFASNPSSMDPVAQLELLAENLDVEVVSIEAGKVTLQGKLAADKREALGQLGALGIDTFQLVLEEKTGFPIEMTFGPTAPGSGDADPVIRMRFENLKKVDRSALPAGIFEYQPPDGVPVTDLAAMLGEAN